MGSNHARVVAESDVADLRVVVDIDADRAAKLASQYGARASTDLDDIASCDAAVVAVTTEAHQAVAEHLLDRDVPLLVEKPLAGDIATVERILAAAAAKGLPIACGFVERFNPAVVTASQIVDGPVIQMHGVRHSPRNPTATATVVQDLLIHDIDLALRFAGGSDVARVQGATWTPQASGGAQVPEIAECLLTFADGAVANLSASRWGQRKIRDLRIVTEQQLLEVDLLRVGVTVYRNVSQALVGDDGYRAETIIDVPYVRHRGEPLALQLEAFVDLVRSGDADAIEAERRTILPPHVVAAEMEQGNGSGN
jgi:predicted dehydrogenase